MVNVVTVAAYRRIYWLRLIGLVQRSAATWRCVLHSSDELGELNSHSGSVMMTMSMNQMSIKYLYSANSRRSTALKTNVL